mgnify:CR=1 FL=1
MSCTRGCCPTNRDHWLSVSVAPSALTTQSSSHLKQSLAREKEWEKDMPAYRELRRQGLQPQRIDGAADLARDATDSLEITQGELIPKNELQVAKDITSIVAENNTAVANIQAKESSNA